MDKESPADEIFNSCLSSLLDRVPDEMEDRLKIDMLEAKASLDAKGDELVNITIHDLPPRLKDYAFPLPMFFIRYMVDMLNDYIDEKVAEQRSASIEKYSVYNPWEPFTPDLGK